MPRQALQRLLPQAPALLLDMLGSADGAPEVPIRSEIFGLQRFAQHGRSLGETHRATALGSGTTVFFPRLRDNLAVLRLAQRYIGAQAASGHDISPAAEWLLDNFHLVEAQLKAIRDGLPKRYFRALPVLQDPPLAGLPRIYGVAWAFVAHTDAAFDEDLLVHYLQAYQETRELTLGEMWALPTTLRVVLIENLRRLAERVATHKAAREVANLCCDHLDAHPLADLVALHAAMQARGVGTEFLAQMAHRLQGRRVSDAADVQAWLQQALPHLAATQAQQIADQAADNLSVSNAIHALRAIGAADWPSIVEHSSSLMGLMLQSPMFSAEHTLTRDQTLHGIEALARSSGQREGAVAQVLLSLMQPASDGSADLRGSVASHWLQGSGRPVLAARLGVTQDRAWQCRRLAQRLALPAYLGALALGTGALLAWALSGLASPLPWDTAWPWLAALLMLLPASEAVVAVVNRLISESAQPRHLSRLALGHGIPPEHRVLVAIPAMLTSATAIRGLVHRLHLHHLANTEACAQFALLSDWPDAATEHSPADTPALDEACRALQALNQRYPAAPGEAPRFILLHRSRRYSLTEQAWIGWERKRGKLELLVAALAGPTPASADAAPPGFMALGELSRLAGPTPYLLTLDSDTELPPGRLRELVAIAAHPQNRPQLDASGRRVAHGYGILQPRMATPLPTHAEQTPYHWLFAGQCGIDPYSAASSEVYQDLFGEGSFSGKGLLQVQAVHAVLGQRLPDGQVLSHDLLEGSLARCAVATDVTVIEDAPSHADVAAARLHRWTRGDWQLLPFLLQWRRYPVCAINRWKMFDNLRRSLVAPAGLALLVLTLVSPGAAALISPGLALALVVAGFTAGPLLGAVAGLAPSRDDIALAHFYREAGAGLGRALGGGAWHLSQLLAQALLSTDAIARALWRMAVSRRQLLQWTTAAATQAAAPKALPAVLQAHWREPLLAAGLLAALLAGDTAHPGLALALCTLWASAPVLGWWASRPAPAGAEQALPAAEQDRLAGIARDSWRFFERCVGADDRHLPPDNLQTAPQDMVAHRTSPTNIGLYLLSAACARRFGWIGTQDFAQRLEATLGTLDTLERYRGHFLNWYDTQTGAALLPRYVSSVDSGNLSGHLLAVAQACRERAAEPADDHAAVYRGLAASRQRLAPLLERHPGLLDSLAAAPAAAGCSVPASALGKLLLPDVALPSSLAGPQAARLQTLLQQASEELLLLRPVHAELPPEGAVELVAPSPGEQLAWLGADHLATLRSAWLDIQAAAADEPGATTRRLLALAERCEQIAWAADYSFLYHPRRRLMHLGLRVAEQELDAGFYDLLASESRLTSLLAIAKADAPVGHWAALGRPFHAVGSTAALRSWSGSMFEYLMPSLVLAEPRGSVLQGACSAAVAEQIAFGELQQLPWGMSESAYAARDGSLAYQYAPQGVPRLALRRTPPEDLVVAPYATALAAQVAPRRAGRNFDTLQALGAWQRYGFIEALDYSPARRSGSAAFTPVCTFMAHHQGMSIVALANVLMDELAQRWCMATPQIEAVASLLHERAPREVPARVDVPPGLPPDASLALQNRPPGPLREVMPGASAVPPTHMLGNGSYSVTLRANGAGQSRRRGVGINRWRDDALRDELGSFVYLRKGSGDRPHSITQHPAPDPAAQYTSTFHADRVCFDATWPLLRAHTTAWVSPEDDIEFRQIDLYNSDDRDLDIELLSAFEVSLAEPRADEAHPVFSNLFVSAEWRADAQALVFERRPRQAQEDGLCMAHFVAHSSAPPRSLRVEADRAQWLGRNQGASQPLARFRPMPVAPPARSASDAADPSSASAAHAKRLLDTGLDPVCAMAVGLRVPAQGHLRLTFATAASTSPAQLAAVIDKYRQAGNVQRASLMSATLMGIQLRSLGLSAPNFAAIQSLSSALLMTLSRPGLAAAAAPPAGAGLCDRRLLWRLGISGDRPILLVDAGALQGLAVLRTLAQALRLWQWGGVTCDLVVVNAEAASYEMALHRELGALRDRHATESSPAGTDAGASAPRPPITALFLLRAEELSPGEVATLRSLARVHLQADGRPLSRHVQAWLAPHEADFELRHGVATTAVPVGLASGAPVALSTGGFNAGNGDFEFAVDALRRPARPWINVLANPGFGCHVSEAGGGHSWALNSRLHQLTPWSNDPLADPPGEWLLLQDRRSGALWSLTPSAHADPHSSYQVVHGQGSSRISHSVRHGGGDVRVSVQWCVDRDSAVKQLQVTIVNGGSKTLHWRLVGAAEWQLGAGRGDRASVASSLLRQRLGAAGAGGSAPARLTALLATQQEQAAGFGGSTAFFGLVGPADEVEDWTADRREFFDARGRLVVPDHCGQRAGAGLDPVAALCAHLTVPAGEQVERVFLLGHAASADAARQLAITAAAKPPAQRLAEVQTHWQQLLQATTVQTPDPLFDVMVNHWLLYQTVACRLWAKAGFYQAGGATGFRDQLQDTLALAWAAPQMLRAQIMLCASRQFAQGDVQHWWHEPGGAGVRTHFSDDLLWLPWAVVHYLRHSADTALLDEQLPFLQGAAIPAGAEDSYDTPAISPETASVYEHAARTLDRSMQVGQHGLPLMGTGDWNDGMNRVGAQGRGESVWLAWMLCRLVDDFAPLAEGRGDHARADNWRAAATGWRAALQGPAWDGEWYRRAFFDDGSPLGASTNPEARIDLIAQAWAVLSQAAPAARQQAAMQAAQQHLVDDTQGLIRLLDPPLQHAQPSAGYIQAYPPGVRENGGQYSHAGVWALMAQAELSRLPRLVGEPGNSPTGDELPYRWFTYLSPAHRARSLRWGAAYRIEPYAVAGDVYSQPPYAGRGGWSWYTGAAAWLHRAAVESIFGLELHATRLRLRPCLPPAWPQARITLRRGGRVMQFILQRGSAPEIEALRNQAGAGTLAVGHWLDWADLPPHSSFVIALPPAA